MEDCQIANNGAGASVVPPPGGRRRSNAAHLGNFVTNNENGLRAVNSGKILSFGNNEVTDNVTDGNPTAVADALISLRSAYHPSRPASSGQ